MPRSRELGRLAPSYDHASSLGRELNDDKRQRRLDGSGQGTVADYAAKAKSALWSETGRRLLTPLEALGEAAMWNPVAFASWRDHLLSRNTEELATIVERVPADRLSQIGKRFTHELLAHRYRQVVDL